jgi:hypothetical protein
MTSRQRILAAMRHEKVDRVPVSPFGLGHLDPEGEAAAELIEKTDPFLGARSGDSALLGTDPDITVTEDGPQRITVYHTPRGDLRTVLTRTEITAYTTEFLCKSHADIEALLSMPWRPARVDAESFLAHKAKVGQRGLVLTGIPDGILWPMDVLSPEDACLLSVEAPGLMRQMVAEGHRRIVDFVSRACPAGVDGYRIVGGEYATEMLGPKGFQEFVAPYDTELVALIHEHGGIAYYHNHGDVRRYLEMLADLGIDFLDPLEVPPYGDVDLGDAVRRIGDRVCLVGGLDDMEVIETRPTQEVQALGREAIRRAGTRGYVLGGTASGTYTERGARNFVALVEVAREFPGQ